MHREMVAMPEGPSFYLEDSMIDLCRKPGAHHVAHFMVSYVSKIFVFELRSLRSNAQVVVLWEMQSAALPLSFILLFCLL